MDKGCRMKYRCLGLFAVVVVVVGLAAVPMAGQGQRHAGSSAAQGKAWTHPRTPWGDPDLQGIWRNLANTNLERPEELKDRAFFTDEEVAQRLKRSNQRIADNLS